MKRAIVAVTNDLVTDQRIHRTALTLLKTGYHDLLLIGRKKKKNSPVSPRSYKTYRFGMVFEKGPFFYAEYNIHLFFFLLFSKTSLIVANDLDTLPACFIASKLKKTFLFYDSHEYFTEVPELIERKFVRCIWKKIEELILPRVKFVSTVSQAIADSYRKEYNVQPVVIRNFPFLVSPPPPSPLPPPTSPTFGAGQVGMGQKIILYQGVLNKGRGLEHAIRAMKYLEGSLLLLIGDGDIRENLEQLALAEGLELKVRFLGQIPFEELPAFTRLAHIGLVLEEFSGLSYRYSLSNKLFDYIHAGVPVLASPLPEIKNIFSRYEIGRMIENHNPTHIASQISDMLSDEKRLIVWKENLKKAALEFCWEKEEEKLSKIIKSFDV